MLSSSRTCSASNSATSTDLEHLFLRICSEKGHIKKGRIKKGRIKKGRIKKGHIKRDRLAKSERVNLMWMWTAMLTSSLIL